MAMWYFVDRLVDTMANYPIQLPWPVSPAPGENGMLGNKVILSSAAIPLNHWHIRDW